MKCVSREMIVPCTNGRPVFPGFISYISNSENYLLHRSGWEDFSDGYDDFADSFSYGNGRSWTEPVLKLKKHETPEGDIRYAENACFLDPDAGKFFSFCSMALYSKDHIDVDCVNSVVYDSYDIASKRWAGQKAVSVEMVGGVGVSFCFPMKTKSGKIIIPACGNLCDSEGKPMHYKDCWAPANISMTIVAEYDKQGDLRFKLGNPTAVDLEKTSRGYSENAIAQLADGRLVMMKRRALERSERKILLAAVSKWGQHANSRIADISVLDDWVVEEATKPILRVCQQNKTRLHEAAKR